MKSIEVGHIRLVILVNRQSKPKLAKTEMAVIAQVPPLKFGCAETFQVLRY